MIKVVVVDDEMLIRVGIKSSLNWEEHGFEIAGMAENGIKALEVIEAVQPDIVLTDIKMPKMDGLELISEIKKRYPFIKTVVLTCLNEIDYVKRAMKLGAEDYILKLSIEPESLLEVLAKVRQAIESNTHSGIEFRHNENEKELKINRYVLKEDIYKKMMAGSIPPEDFADELYALGIDVRAGIYAALCCGIDDYSHAPARSRIDDRYLFKFSLVNILEESLSYCNCDIAEIEEGKYIILLKYDDASNSLLNKNTISGCLKRINNSLKKYLNISISFGVNTSPAGYAHVREACLKAGTAMKYKFYYGRESIVFYDDINGFIGKGITFEYDNEKILLERLDDFDEAGVKSIINGFYDGIAKSGAFEPDAVRKVSVEICSSILKFAKKFDDNGDFILSGFSVHPLDFLMTAETIYDIKQWFTEFVDALYEHIYSLQYKAKRPEIIKLQKYIGENIGENITLEKASRISNISRCYLSSLFKKETGDAFVDYVNKVKMERAKTLIRDHGLKIYEAAERVGISDESYFSKLFKKYMGFSPSKLQKSK